VTIWAGKKQRGFSGNISKGRASGIQNNERRFWMPFSLQVAT